METTMMEVKQDKAGKQENIIISKIGQEELGKNKYYILKVELLNWI